MKTNFFKTLMLAAFLSCVATASEVKKVDYTQIYECIAQQSGIAFVEELRQGKMVMNRSVSPAKILLSAKHVREGQDFYTKLKIDFLGQDQSTKVGSDIELVMYSSLGRESVQYVSHDIAPLPRGVKSASGLNEAMSEDGEITMFTLDVNTEVGPFKTSYDCQVPQASTPTTAEPSVTEPTIADLDKVKVSKMEPKHSCVAIRKNNKEQYTSDLDPQDMAYGIKVDLYDLPSKGYMIVDLTTLKFEGEVQSTAAMGVVTVRLKTKDGDNIVLNKGTTPVRVFGKGEQSKVMRLSSLRLGQIGSFPMGCIKND